MEQETQWLEFNWRDKAYAVLMSDVEGIIHQNRRNRTQPLAMIPLVFLTDGSVDGEEKWLIPCVIVRAACIGRGQDYR